MWGKIGIHVNKYSEDILLPIQILKCVSRKRDKIGYINQSQVPLWPDIVILRFTRYESGGCIQLASGKHIQWPNDGHLDRFIDSSWTPPDYFTICRRFAHFSCDQSWLLDVKFRVTNYCSVVGCPKIQVETSSRFRCRLLANGNTRNVGIF